MGDCLTYYYNYVRPTAKIGVFRPYQLKLCLIYFLGIVGHNTIKLSI